MSLFFSFMWKQMFLCMCLACVLLRSGLKLLAFAVHFPPLSINFSNSWTLKSNVSVSSNNCVTLVLSHWHLVLSSSRWVSYLQKLQQPFIFLCLFTSCVLDLRYLKLTLTFFQASYKTSVTHFVCSCYAVFPSHKVC